MSGTEKEQVLARVNKYKWYHQIEVTGGLYTRSADDVIQSMWDFNLRSMNIVDFNDKRVLDVGCRDGLFSFEAEKRGAREIIAIDNDLSLGATDFLIPFFGSKVKMHQMNVYDLTPQHFGSFDLILFFGVLYHLRYPVWGLKRLVDCLSEKGFLLIESGMMVDARFENQDFLYCPFEDSPYEPTSCTFFNQKGLSTTMRSLGCKFIDCKTLNQTSEHERKTGLLHAITRRLRSSDRESETGNPAVNRQFLTYQKDLSAKDTFLNDDSDRFLEAYWDGTHDFHTKHDA